jgi:hypothetical protein
MAEEAYHHAQEARQFTERARNQDHQRASTGGPKQARAPVPDEVLHYISVVKQEPGVPAPREFTPFDTNLNQLTQ